MPRPGSWLRYREQTIIAPTIYGDVDEKLLFDIILINFVSIFMIFDKTFVFCFAAR